jgi:hypothetical protein
MRLFAFTCLARAACFIWYAKVSMAEDLPGGWLQAVDKISARVSQMNQRRVDLYRRALVVYHIGDLGLASNSVDIAINNMKIFLSSIVNHTKSAKYRAFYVFNIIDLDNPLVELIPSRSNVALVQWKTSRSDLDTHLRAMHLLGANLTSQFGTVIFSNQGVRGPLIHRDNGEWIGDFARALENNNVGMVGPTISCELSPHVQTHMFALRASLIPVVLQDMRQKMQTKFNSWQDLISSLEVGLTGVVIKAGYNVSSFMHQSRGQSYFQRCLNYSGPANRFAGNPTSWCGVSAQDLGFVKWGGELLRTAGMACNTSVLQMEDTMERLQAAEPRLQLILPEALRGGRLFSLFREYAQEAWIDRHPVLLPASAEIGTNTIATTPDVPQFGVESDLKQAKVCFLVRVIRPLHSQRQYENPLTHLINKEIELIITSKFS